MFLPSFLSGVDFYLYLFLSLVYGTQVGFFAAIPAICRLCLSDFDDAKMRGGEKKGFCKLVLANLERKNVNRFFLYLITLVDKS